MQRTFIVLAGAAALALGGCGGKQEAAAENAQDNLAAQAEDTAANLAAMSSNVADANQANMLVNESLELTNASEAVDNAEGDASGNAH